MIGMGDPFALAERRYMLTEHGARFCPRCGTGQIQLKMWYAKPAEYKCRECHAEFSFEPKPAK